MSITWQRFIFGVVRFALAAKDNHAQGIGGKPFIYRQSIAVILYRFVTSFPLETINIFNVARDLERVVLQK